MIDRIKDLLTLTGSKSKYPTLETQYSAAFPGFPPTGEERRWIKQSAGALKN